MDADAHHPSVLPLDERFYNPDSTFLKQQTGIDDDDELKTHLLSIQAEAYKVTHFLFTWPLSDSIMHARCIHSPAYASFHGQGISLGMYNKWSPV